ncbi:hypothetical protein [Flavobacterium sp.]|uniref:hypothetical protein n=1 Tax=Flavobacterium sp. TaxID=239 RepID=UPI0037525928
MNNSYKLLFLLLFSISYGQSYKPLLDAPTQWHFTTCYFGCISDVYYTDGDTIVNGKNYKILDGYHYNSRTFLLREEINTKKVYLSKINENSISEYLLYDFSLLEGAQFNMANPLSPFPQNGGKYVLDSIRMKPLENNIKYKHFYFSPASNNQLSNGNPVWIEGIGSKSLINAPGGNPDINSVGQLSCFFKDKKVIYSQLDSISNCTYLEIKTKHPKQSLDNLKIYASNERNVFFLSNAEMVYSINLIDIYGKSVKEFKIINSKAIEQISLENYAAGIYFLLAFDENLNRKTFKIILK